MNTPEHDKQRAILDQSQAIGEFLEWLAGEGYDICEYSCGQQEYFPCSLGTEQLLAKYFGIDLKKIAEEKDEMVEEYRKSIHDRITS